MKKLIALMTIFTITMIAGEAFARVHVNGYYRSNGTYVNSHYRSSPDSVKWNNYSY